MNFLIHSQSTAETGSGVAVVRACREGACREGACREGTCYKGAYYKGACYKEGGISNRVGIRGRVRISGKVGIGVNSNKDGALSIIYSGGVSK